MPGPEGRCVLVTVWIGCRKLDAVAVADGDDKASGQARHSSGRTPMNVAVYDVGRVRRIRRIASCVAVAAALLLVCAWALLVALRAGYFDVEVGPAPVVAV